MLVVAIATGRSVVLHCQRLDSIATCQIEHRYLHGAIRRPTPSFRANRINLTDERQLGQHRYHLYLAAEDSPISFYRYGGQEKAAIADQETKNSCKHFSRAKASPSCNFGIVTQVATPGALPFSCSSWFWTL